ncbi:MAG: hypothetical protein ABW168_02045 [Sedimenticola sp.]
MQDQSDTEKVLSKTEMLFTALALAVIGAFIGLIVRIIYGSITILPISELLIDIAPAIIAGAIAGGVLAFKLPRVASVIICFMPMGCEVS